MGRKKEAQPDAAPPELSQYQSFRPERVLRDDIEFASYNPRRDLTDAERRKLKGLLKRHGLFNAVVVNRRSEARGFPAGSKLGLVGGHQRLKILDALEGGRSYLLDVDMVDVDPKLEKELNVAHNNQNAGADYDIGKLGDLFAKDGISFEGAGFDSADIYRIFGTTVFESENQDASLLNEMNENVRKFSESVKRGAAKTREKRGGEFYTVLIWQDGAARNAGHAELGLDENRYQDGRALLARISSSGENS